MSAKKILDVTRSQVGVREGRLSSGSWNNQVKYNDWYVEVTGHNWFRNAAWCAIFVSWVAAQAGVSTDVIPRHAWTPAGLEWFKKRREGTHVRATYFTSTTSPRAWLAT